MLILCEKNWNIWLFPSQIYVKYSNQFNRIKNEYMCLITTYEKHALYDYLEENFASTDISQIKKNEQ